MRSSSTRSSAETSRSLASRSLASRLPEFLSAVPARRALQLAVVAVVGTGSIGSLLVLELCRLGVGTLVLIDPGVFKAESAATHLCETPVGQRKVNVLARACRAFPATRTVPIAAAIEAVPSALLGADLVALASDNLACEVAVTQLARRRRTPLLQASLDGEGLVAHVRSLSNDGPDAPCLACGYGADEWAALRADQVFSCAGARTPDPERVPTRSPSFLCALAASMLAKDVVLRLAGHPRAARDTIVEYRGFTDTTVTTPLVRRHDCPLDHAAWSVLALRGTVASQSFDGLLARARAASGVPEDAWVLQADGLRFMPRVCLACSSARTADSAPAGRPAHRRGGRFLSASGKPPLCLECGVMLDPAVDGLAAVAAAHLDDRARSRSLRALGLASAPCVVLRCPDRGLLLTGGAR
ncbi:MAG TPA: ThiF family adenylyltransferase [Planctomycetota bacterium]